MAKMLSSSKNPDPQQQQQQLQLLHITQHDKFYSRLLSKDTSLANPSFRVYYGGASGAVPFLWESQPGTPKKAVTAPALPPLTPPPSYHSNPKKKRAAKNPPRRSSSLIQCILPRLLLRRSPNSTRSSSAAAHLSSTSTSQLVSPSSSTSTSSSGSTGSRWIRYNSSPRSSFSSSRADDEDFIDHEGSPAASGCYSMLTLKKSLLHLVGGHGSG